ncbi:MAG: TraR/DksA family transcriptional regulator [Pseudobdellovibrionaceae bacterium]
MFEGLSSEFIQQCRQKLLLMKQDLLNRSRHLRSEFAENDKSSGDEIDQTVAQLAEHGFLVAQERIRHQLIEIEFALARIQNGQFGFCEETQELIEAERLLALPYTRLSIEGAEIREAFQKRFAR